jgi:hypothetical protein
MIFSEISKLSKAYIALYLLTSGFTEKIKARTSLPSVMEEVYGPSIPELMTLSFRLAEEFIEASNKNE